MTLRLLRRVLGGGETPPAAHEVKTPVKVTVTARKVHRDGSLGEEIVLNNVRVERVEGEPHG